MIVVKQWSSLKGRKSGWVRYYYTGWFLFGIVPLLIKREGVAR